jgi:hypothetical protein
VSCFCLSKSVSFQRSPLETQQEQDEMPSEARLPA